MVDGRTKLVRLKVSRKKLQRAMKYFGNKIIAGEDLKGFTYGTETAFSVEN